MLAGASQAGSTWRKTFRSQPRSQDAFPLEGQTTLGLGTNHGCYFLEGGRGFFQS